VIHPMFSPNASYVAVLRDVAYQCALPYISSVHEVLEDGTHIYGIEYEVLPSPTYSGPRTFFFWGDPRSDPAVAYESAAMDGLAALERFYGFVAVDNGLRTLQLYRSVALRLLPVANRGAQLARFVIAASHQQCIPWSTLTVCAQQLLAEVASDSQGSNL
jgi:hypothetical protein